MVNLSNLRPRPSNQPGRYREDDIEDLYFDRPAGEIPTVEYDPSLPPACFPTRPFGIPLPDRLPEETGNQIGHGAGLQTLTGIGEEGIGDDNAQEAPQGTMDVDGLVNVPNQIERTLFQPPESSNVPRASRATRTAAIPRDYRYMLWVDVEHEYCDINWTSISPTPDFKKKELIFRTIEEPDGYRARQVKVEGGVMYFTKCPDEGVVWKCLSTGAQMVLARELSREGTIERALAALGLDRTEREAVIRDLTKQFQIVHMAEPWLFDRFLTTGIWKITWRDFEYTAAEFARDFKETFGDYQPTVYFITIKDVNNMLAIVGRIQCDSCGDVESITRKIKEYAGETVYWRDMGFHLPGPEDEARDVDVMYPDDEKSLNPFDVPKREEQSQADPLNYQNSSAFSHVPVESEAPISKGPKARKPAAPRKTPRSVTANAAPPPLPVRALNPIEASGAPQSGSRRKICIKLNISRKDVGVSNAGQKTEAGDPLQQPLMAVNGHHEHGIDNGLSNESDWNGQLLKASVSETQASEYGSTGQAPISFGQTSYMDRIRNDPLPSRNQVNPQDLPSLSANSNLSQLAVHNEPPQPVTPENRDIYSAPSGSGGHRTLASSSEQPIEQQQAIECNSQQSSTSSQGALMPNTETPSRGAILGSNMPLPLRNSEILKYVSPEAHGRAAQYSTSFQRSFGHESTRTPIPGPRKTSIATKRAGDKPSKKKVRFDLSIGSVTGMTRSQDYPPKMSPGSTAWISYSGSPPLAKPKQRVKLTLNKSKGSAEKVCTPSKAAAVEGPCVAMAESTQSPGATTMGQFFPIQNATPSVADVDTPIAGNGWAMGVVGGTQANQQMIPAIAAPAPEPTTNITATSSFQSHGGYGATSSEMHTSNQNGSGNHNQISATNYMNGSQMMSTHAQNERTAANSDTVHDNRQHWAKRPKYE